MSHATFTPNAPNPDRAVSLDAFAIMAAILYATGMPVVQAVGEAAEIVTGVQRFDWTAHDLLKGE